MKTTVIALVTALVAVASTHASTILVDDFTTAQNLSTASGSITNTVASASSVGGYRTAILTTAGGESATTLLVSAVNNRFSLSSPTDATASFTLLWGGADGTSGLGGINMTGGVTDLSSINLKFNQRSADFASNFTWSFTDISNNVATYTGVFPVWSSSSPLNEFSIAYSDFSNSGSIDWTKINFISLSGGNVLELDLSLARLDGAGITVEAVPEPSTYALLALTAVGLAVHRWRKRNARA